MSSLTSVLKSRTVWAVAIVLAVLVWVLIRFLSPDDDGPLRNTPFPEVAFSETLQDAAPGERVWVYGIGSPNFVDGRAYLYDLNGERLGQLSTGFWHNNLVPIDQRSELISVETYFSRGTRGDRVDIVAAYDATTLRPKFEIEIPAKRMTAVTHRQLVSLTSDQRFLAVTNYTPAQSISIVDLDQRAFVTEIETPGCMLPHEAGLRSFYLICNNGSFLHIRLNESGNPDLIERTEVLFDAVNDPLTAAPSKSGDKWFFLTRYGNVQVFSVDDTSIEKTDEWSIFSDRERRRDWTIAGIGHTAVHEATSEFYALVRQGGEHDFESPGEEVWVFDTETGERLRKIKLKDFTLAIDVSQTDNPRLLTSDVHIPVSGLEEIRIFMSDGLSGFDHIQQSRLNIYDAKSGEHLVLGPVNVGGAFMAAESW